MARRKNTSKADWYPVGVVLAVLTLTFNPQLIKSILDSLFYIAIFLAELYFLKSFFFKKNKGVQPQQSQNKTRVSPTFDIQEEVTKKQGIQPKVQAWSLELIHALEWKRFEALCAGYFTATGYRAEVSRLGADGGVDVFLYKASYSEDKVFAIVQCKAWSTYKVGVKPVRELYGVMASEQAPLSIFITSGDYTREAEKFAKGKHLKLITGQLLLKLLKGLPDEKQQSLIAEITKGDYTTPSCPSCGDKMINRKSKQGGGNAFWGCANFPRCRHTLRIKQAS